MVFIALKVAMLIDHVCVNYTELYIYMIFGVYLNRSGHIASNIYGIYKC